ncbi:unnamed protein product, partial [Chrysoparadoxa australica]
TDQFFSGLWVDPANPPVIEDFTDDDYLFYAVPPGETFGASLSLEEDPIWGNVHVLANGEIVTVLLSPQSPVTLDKILFFESERFA